MNDREETWESIGEVVARVITKLTDLLRRRLCDSCPHTEQERFKERMEIRAEQRAAFAANMRRWRRERIAKALAKMIEGEADGLRSTQKPQDGRNF